MVVVLLVAGLGLFLAGLVTVAFGIRLDLSFGNTLILAGAITACTGMILLAVWTLVRELKNIARQFGGGVSAASRAGNSLPPVTVRRPDDQLSGDPDLLLGHDVPFPESAGKTEPGAPSATPWLEETTARRDRQDAPLPPAAAEPVVKPRRNLLFSSTSRKERERAQARAGEPSATEVPATPPAAPPPVETTEARPATFDEAWPQSERARSAETPRRSARVPSTFTESNEVAAAEDRIPPAMPDSEQPQVTVLKSGVVDGMAYSLYSDGSIEAQMPEGMMRFASIDELRSHLDQRP